MLSDVSGVGRATPSSCHFEASVVQPLEASGRLLPLGHRALTVTVSIFRRDHNK
jgi:hypothetical protein